MKVISWSLSLLEEEVHLMASIFYQKPGDFSGEKGQKPHITLKRKMWMRNKQCKCGKAEFYALWNFCRMKKFPHQTRFFLQTQGKQIKSSSGQARF